MKVYEIRDVSNDETYFTKGFVATLIEAVDLLGPDGYQFSDCDEDWVHMAVYEHEVGAFQEKDGFNRRMFEVHYTNKYLNEEDSEMSWTREVVWANPKLTGRS